MTTRKKISSGYNRAIAHRNSKGNGCQRMHKIIKSQAEKLPAWRGEGENKVSPLAEEL